MGQVATKRMTVDEFLVWAEGREGKWELHDGEAVAMDPERARHSLVKAYAIAALVNAIRRAAAPYRVYADGLAIRVRRNRAFRPDVVVVCPGMPPHEQATSTPLIAVEVLSPSSAPVDRGVKLDSYFTLPSLAHYLILDPDARALAHHRRAPDGTVEPRLRHDGALRLDPQGIEVAVEDLFGPAD
jgi:Uma2 family endonuclease